MRSCFLRAGLLIGVAVLSACTRSVKAEFPRPPVTASVPEPVETPEPPTPPVEAPAPELAEPEPEPEIEEPDPEPAEEPAPEPPPSPPEPEEEPAPEPPLPQLAGAEEVDPEVTTKLERADSLLSAVNDRELSRDQRNQIVAARSFVLQAQRALDEGDERRALVLVDKGLILAEDVERTSRP